MSETVVYGYGEPEGNRPISNYNDTSNPIKRFFFFFWTLWIWMEKQASPDRRYIYCFYSRIGNVFDCDAISANNVMFSNLFIYSGCLHRWIGISKQKCVFWHQSLTKWLHSRLELRYIQRQTHTARTNTPNFFFISRLMDDAFYYFIKCQTETSIKFVIIN